MNLLTFIIVATIVTIIIACLYLANSKTINNYLQATNLGDYDKYDIRLIDDSDINYINKIIPGHAYVIVPNPNISAPSSNNLMYASNGTNGTNEENGTNRTNEENGTNAKNGTNAANGTRTNAGNGTNGPYGRNEFFGLTKLNGSINNTTTLNNPNAPITDNMLLEPNEQDRNFGYELPWDKEVGFCEVLNNTDMDLYDNVQDSTTITFY